MQSSDHLEAEKIIATSKRIVPGSVSLKGVCGEVRELLKVQTKFKEGNAIERRLAKEAKKECDRLLEGALSSEECTKNGEVCRILARLLIFGVDSQASQLVEYLDASCE